MINEQQIGSILVRWIKRETEGNDIPLLLREIIAQRKLIAGNNEQICGLLEEIAELKKGGDCGADQS